MTKDLTVIGAIAARQGVSYTAGQVLGYLIRKGIAQKIYLKFTKEDMDQPLKAWDIIYIPTYAELHPKH